MHLLDEIRENKLTQLARERFDTNLSEAELKVLRDSASSEELQDPDEDTQRPELRAEFLRWLASDSEAAPQIDPKGLRVYAATVPGKLDLRGCCVHPTLDFRRCTFQSIVDLRSAEIQELFFFNSSLAAGMSADRVVIHGSLFLRGTKSEGGIRLVGAEIAGDIECSGAKLKANDGALLADRSKISGDVFLGEGFEASGEICFVGAKIEGSLHCDGARLLATKRHALDANRAEIGGSVYFRRGFVSSGDIRLHGAQVGGQLNFLGAEVTSIDCINLRLSGDLLWMGIRKSKETRLDLTGASVKNLRDDRESWPTANRLILNGLVYEELTLHAPRRAENTPDGSWTEEQPLKADERTAWLMVQSPDRRVEPQPWVYLSKHLEAKGDHQGAKHVLYLFHCLQATKSSPFSRRTQIAFAWLEEAPQRIGWFIGLTLVLFTAIFWNAGSQGALAPTDKVAYAAFAAGEPVPFAYPSLNPFIYTLENAFPLVRLGQDDKWAPDRQYPSKSWWTRYSFLMWSRWVLVVWGWFQAGIFGAAVVGRFKS